MRGRSCRRQEEGVAGVAGVAGVQEFRSCRSSRSSGVREFGSLGVWLTS